MQLRLLVQAFQLFAQMKMIKPGFRGYSSTVVGFILRQKYIFENIEYKMITGLPDRNSPDLCDFEIGYWPGTQTENKPDASIYRQCLASSVSRTLAFGPQVHHGDIP